MILVIDNYDSFTYNLVQYLGEMGRDMQVYRNDRISVDEALKIDPDFIVISPGPGTPDSAGISMELIRRFAGLKPILGVCLGHQAIGAVFGGKIVKAKRIMHGKSSMIFHNDDEIFIEIPNPFKAIRYHSLVVDPDSVPETLEITAWTDKDEIMGVKHRDYPVYGIQFHPESVMSDYGKELLANFLEIVNRGESHDQVDIKQDSVG
jgi:anthranilate synthase/aminodeoxychorismate synthase-like glutamine amidotransferase